MEASEKPQLPLAAPDGTVRALGDRLVIESLEVTDARAARLVRERAEAGQAPARTVADAIEIGSRVLDREDAAAEVDYVRAEFEQHASALRERLGKTLESGDQQLAERIAQSFDAGRDGSVPQEIETRMQQALTEHRESLLKLFSAQEGSNPLFDFKDAMVKVYRELGTRQQHEGEENRKVIADLRRELVELKERTTADERVAEAEAAGTRKGRSFEERVHEGLDRLADGRGDCAHHVGDERGAGGTKKGDTVIEIGVADGACQGRIVFEAKDERLSKNEAWAELNGAMQERHADFAVLVVAGEERIPRGREQLVEYEGNKLITAVDPELPDDLGLDLAYRYARLRCLLRREGELELDAAGVRVAAEAAGSALKRFQSVRLALTNIDKSTAKAREGVNEIENDVQTELARIESLVAEAESVADDADD
jgi:flagellar biosynthesis chaperone FliJ